MSLEMRRVGVRAAACGAALGVLLGAVPAAFSKAPKAERRFNFADIGWYTPARAALAELGAKGYRTIPGTREAVVAQGRTFDHISVARGLLDDSSRVVRWEVTVIAESKEDRFREMKPIYEQVVTECKGRYGPPWDSAEKYKFPYDKADGRETNALKDGKAMIHAIWRGSQPGDRLVVEMNPDANVVLTYTCPGWGDFLDRVRRRKGRDL